MTCASCSLHVPEALRRARAHAALTQAAAAAGRLALWRDGGFARLDELPVAELVPYLLAEARTATSDALLSDVRQSDGEDVRGGEPARRFHSAAGAALQRALYHSPHLAGVLANRVGTAVIPSGERGSYTYYAQPGDFLAVHRDVANCDVAVITCLYDNAARNGAGGVLVVYPSRVAEPLSSIRARPGRGGVGLRLGAGETIVLLGGLLPHAVTPVRPGQQRVISVLCYQFADLACAT